MDETKPTSAPASANRERLAGIKRSVTRALTVVALLVALCVFMGLPLILSGVIVFLASSSAALFTFLVVTAVLTELFDAKEWARTRLGEKQASVDLRPFFADLGGILRPVLRPFSSWHPFGLGRFGEAVLLPDSMAIFGVCLASLAMTSIVMTSASISILVGAAAGYILLPLPAIGGARGVGVPVRPDRCSMGFARGGSPHPLLCLHSILGPSRATRCGAPLVGFRRWNSFQVALARPL